MALLLSMLPLYLVGNFHCIGMCGPLVLMIGRHRHRLWYFAGRTAAFTLAAALAGGLGSVINVFLHRYHLSSIAALLFGAGFILYGAWKSAGWSIPRLPLPLKVLQIQKYLATLMLHDTASHTFAFGLATVLLPCGQSMIVFSACALTGDPLIGAMNGFVFALATSPSLFMAMNAHHLLSFGRRYYNLLLGVCAIGAGILALCRGLAEMGVISHLVLWDKYHIVLY